MKWLDKDATLNPCCGKMICKSCAVNHGRERRSKSIDLTDLTCENCSAPFKLELEGNKQLMLKQG